MRVSYTSNIADQFTQNMKYVILQTGITALEIHIFLSSMRLKYVEMCQRYQSGPSFKTLQPGK